MSIKKAIDSFKLGKVVAMPTETVYGLAAPINRLELIEKVFILKKRPSFDPLIVHVSDSKMAKKYSSDFSLRAQKLADAFWPGPLTIIVKKNELIDSKITSGLDTVGIRCPRHKVALGFIKELGVAVAAPSANTFTKTSPTSSLHVRKYFDEKDVMILEGGECEVGIESTIVDVSKEKVKVLRPGMLSLEEISNVLGESVVSGDEHLKSVPGAHHIHYQPDYELMIALSDDYEVPGNAEVIKVKNRAALLARELYKMIHSPLNEGKLIRVIDLSEALKSYPEDYWEGILNRLKKAASQVL